jgi:hypothetical protein
LLKLGADRIYSSTKSHSILHILEKEQYVQTKCSEDLAGDLIFILSD